MKTKRLLATLALGLGLTLTLGILLSTGRAASPTQPLLAPGTPSTVLFRDDFNGAIDGSWTIQNNDSSYYTITADHLELRANAGDIYAGLNNHKNLFLIDPPTTTADFDLTIRVIEFSPAHQHAAQIDLVAYDDDDNLVRDIYGYPLGAHYLEFGAEVGGAYSNSGGADPEAMTPMDFGNDPFCLRLRKVGNIYRQYYSTDGVVFTATRKILTYGDGTPAKVGFVALADPSESSVAKIDWLEITQLLIPGNPIIHPISNTHTAPVTTTVSITYDDAIDPATVSTQTFAVHAMQTGLLPEAYSVDSGTITLSPTHPFKPGELVQASATAGTLNTSGEGPIPPTVWQFQAAAAGGSGFFVDSGQNLGSSDSYRVTLGDLDGDGDLDAFVPNGIWPSTGLPNTVWLNDGTGSFTDSGQTLGNSASLGAALGDLDGDGDLDAFVANGGYQPNQIWRNNGTGTFVSGQSLGGAYSWSASLGDIDGDGDLDAFVANGVNQANRVWVNDGTGTFSGGQSLGGSDSGDVALGDLDGDGDLDAFVVNFVGQPARVWLNDGTGIFGDSGQDLGGSHSHRVALGDVDGDGDLDAFVVHQGGQANTLWLNNGTGVFIDSGQNLGSVGRDIALGDLDGDGDLDGFVAIAAAGANKVWQNDGTGTFTETQGIGDSFSLSVALGDVDGDGELDAFVGNYSGPNKVWLNTQQVFVPFVLK